jgi:type IV secretion system protein VirD4
MRSWLLIVCGIVLAVLAAAPVPHVSAASPVMATAAWVCLLWGCLRRPGAETEVSAPLAGAAWAVWEEAATLATPGPFLLGLWPTTRTPLYLSEEALSGHVLVLGPSRAGKTAGSIAPNVLLRDPARESIIVLDVKTGPRSLWNVTAGHYGKRASLFCPAFEGSISYNPLEDVTSIGAAQRKAGLLVQNTTPRDLSGDARVYAAASTDLAALLFLHVQEERRRGGHTVGAVFRLAMEGPEAIRSALRASPVAEVRERHGIFTSRERRIQEAAVTGVLERLAPWADPLVCEATSQHFDLGIFGREPAALYILLPETEGRRFQPLVAWLVADLIDGLIDQADRTGLRCPVRVYLDEFRQFGYLAGLSERLPTLRDRGISVLLGVQVVSQIERVYGRAETRTLLGNTETKVLFRAGDLETAQMISAWLGRTSVPAVSITTRGAERSTTIRPHVRPLVAAEDVTRLPEGAVIVLPGASKPVALWQARYFETPGFRVTPPPFPLRLRATPGLHPRISEGAARPPRRRTPPPRPAGGVRP